MATNWLIVTADDVKDAFGSLFVDQDNGEDFDPTAAANVWIPIIVAQVRGMIQTGNRTGVSITAGAVPPEAKGHVLVLVAEKIIINTPRLVGYIVLEGENGPLARSLMEARKWLSDVANKGLDPTHPTDLDPTTAPFGTQWGDDAGDDTAGNKRTDLTIDSPPY